MNVEGKPIQKRPRVSKQDKERAEREKAQRENLAVLASKPMGHLPSAPMQI